MVGGSNGQTIRGALIDLIKFYVGREIKFDELSHLLGCICAIHDEVVVRITCWWLYYHECFHAELLFTSEIIIVTSTWTVMLLRLACLDGWTPSVSWPCKWPGQHFHWALEDRVTDWLVNIELKAAVEASYQPCGWKQQVMQSSDGWDFRRLDSVLPPDPVCLTLTHDFCLYCWWTWHW